MSERAVDRNAALVTSLRELIAALPKCDFCERPAMKAWMRGGSRFCGVDHPSAAPDYPRAEPLRRALKLLESL